MSRPETPEPIRDPETVNEIARFAKLVKLMRHAQNQYFRGDRSTTCLAQCRDLERRADKAITWILAHRQGELPLGDDQAPATDGPRRIEIDPPRPGAYTSGDRNRR